MTQVLLFLIFGSIVILVPLLFAYARSLGRLCEYSKEKNLPIFCQKYRSSLTLGADGYFLNELFSGKKIHEVEDAGLKRRLSFLSRLLRLQIVLGLIVVGAAIVGGFVAG